MQAHRVTKDLQKQFSDLHESREIYSFDLAPLIARIQQEFPLLFKVDTYSDGLYFSGTNSLVISKDHEGYSYVLDVVRKVIKGEAKLGNISLCDGTVISAMSIMDPKFRLTTKPAYSPLVEEFVYIYIHQCIGSQLAYKQGSYIGQDVALRTKKEKIFPIINFHSAPSDFLEWVLDRDSKEFAEDVVVKRIKYDCTKVLGLDISEDLAKEILKFVKFNLDELVDRCLPDFHKPVSSDPWAMFTLDFKGTQLYMHKQGDFRAMKWVMLAMEDVEKNMD